MQTESIARFRSTLTHVFQSKQTTDLSIVVLNQLKCSKLSSTYLVLPLEIYQL